MVEVCPVRFGLVTRTRAPVDRVRLGELVRAWRLVLLGRMRGSRRRGLRGWWVPRAGRRGWMAGVRS